MRISILLLFVTIACKRESNEINYPKPYPEDKPRVFRKGLVSRGPDSLDFNAAFSPDGAKFLFSRSQGGKYIIMESQFNEKEWTAPVISPLFDTVYSNTDPFFTADGSIYFISNRPQDAADSTDDYDIYVMHKTAKSWKDPERMEINSDSTEYYVSLSRSGNIYFASQRDGNLDLFMSVKEGEHYKNPVNLAMLNSEADEHDPFIAPDESYIIFTSSRKGGFGQADLYISRHVNSQWQKPVNMGAAINTESYEYCPNLSPDNQYLFYSSEFDVKWVSSAILEGY